MSAVPQCYASLPWTESVAQGLCVCVCVCVCVCLKVWDYYQSTRSISVYIISLITVPCSNYSAAGDTFNSQIRAYVKKKNLRSAFRCQSHTRRRTKKAKGKRKKKIQFLLLPVFLLKIRSALPCSPRSCHSSVASPSPWLSPAKMSGKQYRNKWDRHVWDVRVSFFQMKEHRNKKEEKKKSCRASKWQLPGWFRRQEAG